MASIHKQSGKPFWFCSYSTWSAEKSKWQRHFKSTKMTEKKAAAEVCRAWEQTAKIGRTGKLTPEVEREVVARGVADIFTAINSETMPSSILRQWCGATTTRWINSWRFWERKPTVILFLFVQPKYYASVTSRPVS